MHLSLHRVSSWDRGVACKWSQLQEGVFQEQKVEAANPLRSESANRVNCFCLLGLVKKVVESAKISREGSIVYLSLRRSVSHPSYVVTFVYLFIFLQCNDFSRKERCTLQRPCEETLCNTQLSFGTFLNQDRCLVYLS